jgi:chitinase
MNEILNPLARLSASLAKFTATATLIVGIAAPAQAALPASYQHPVMGYFDTTGKASDIDRIPWGSLTHLNIAFAGINAEGQCAWMDASGNDEPDTSGMMPELIKKLVAARDANGKNTKLVLSVGGWTMSYRFYEATKTWQKTDALAASCVALMQKSGLDGLDYDWEYPTKLGKKNCPKGMVCETRDDPAQGHSL